MVLTVYSQDISQPGRAVLIFVRLANIEHELVVVDLMTGEQRKPEFLAKFPQGKIPAISDGDFNLTESHAIMTYLATTRQVADHWYPADPQKRALVDRYLHWHHGNLRKAGTVIYGTLIVPMFGSTMPEAIIADAIDVRAKSFAQLEAWLTASPYLTGDEMSIADLSALCEVTQHRLVEFDMSPYPHVQAWVNRLMENPVIAELHQVLNGLRAVIDARTQERAKQASTK